VTERSFGECRYCDRQVTFPGWDEVCDDCAAEIREENAAADERIAEEDHFLYSIPAAPSTETDG
jgi:hypothetical protein